MNFSVRWNTVLCFLLLTVEETCGQIKPSNAVTKIGGAAIFNCTGTSVTPHWFLSKDGADTNQLVIAESCTVMDDFNNNYETERTGAARSCNLLVFNVTMEQAGTYCCDGGANSYALLTVTDSYPVITVNNTNGTVTAMENESVIIECTLNYNGSMTPAPTLRPYFYWTDSSGKNVSKFNESTTDNIAVSQLKVPAGRQDIKPYTCHVYFRLEPPTNTDYASNTPTVSSSASSRIIDVLYSAKITSITSSVSTVDNCVYKTENFTCTADADPPAQYEWLDLNNGTISNGSIKYITSGGRYQCRAYNHIGGNDTGIANATSCNPPYNTTISGLSCVNNSCTCYENQTMVEISCFAAGVPVPSVHWRSDVPGREDLGVQETIVAEYDGNYTCTANNTFGNQPHNETDYIEVSSCPQGSSLIWLTFLIYPVVGWILGGIFAIYYGKSNKESIYNTDFPFLEKMLPCMNTHVIATTFERFGWIILYILMVTFAGIFVIPFMVIKVQFCKTTTAEVDIIDVELNRPAHPENDAPPPKETTVDEKANDENVVKKTKKKKKKKKVTA